MVKSICTYVIYNLYPQISQSADNDWKAEAVNYPVSKHEDHQAASSPYQIDCNWHFFLFSFSLWQMIAARNQYLQNSKHDYQSLSIYIIYEIDTLTTILPPTLDHLQGKEQLRFTLDGFFQKGSASSVNLLVEDKNLWNWSLFFSSNEQKFLYLSKFKWIKIPICSNKYTTLLSMYTVWYRPHKKKENRFLEWYYGSSVCSYSLEKLPVTTKGSGKKKKEIKTQISGGSRTSGNRWTMQGVLFSFTFFFLVWAKPTLIVPGQPKITTRKMYIQQNR